MLLPATLALAPAAQAQLFWQPPDVTSPPVTGAEPESGVGLPGASPAELNAGLLWSLRAALNVAALQCDFEPTLLTTSNYNAMLAHHRAELASAFKTVGEYFTRTHGSKAGQKQFDQYGTRTYSAYSTVQAQRNFCQTAGSVGRDALFAPRGQLHRVAQARLGELRKALVAQPDRVYGNPAHGFVASLPPLDKKCWKRETLTKKCAQAWLKSKPG
ncbi:MAG TPA: hypothetical protein VL918_03900 [Sphingobium sp.]|nr:hypothetical protein [Sphingobium sp.]